MTVTDLEGLVDADAGLVSSRVFADPDLYRLEQERVFARSWLFLAHESQIANPDDYFTTYMGADPVVVVRQRDGSIGAFLNACRHRGLKVCRGEVGNAKAFMCPYHGWTYDTSGQLVNVPSLDSAYYNALDTASFGLVPVAQVETYKGLIFGNFAPDAPPLREYLGPMAWHLDALVDRRECGTEVIGGVHKWTVKANWKVAAEQFTGDNYHADLTHASAAMALIPPGITIDSATIIQGEGRQFSSEWGHGCGYLIDPTGGLMGAAMFGGPVLGEYLQQTQEETVARLGRARVEGPFGGNANLFPNFAWLSYPVNALRVWHPKGPDEMEVWSWIIVDKDAPPEVKEAQRITTMRTFGPGGLFEVDDSQNWSQIGSNLAHGGAMVRALMLNYQMGLGRDSGADPDYPGLIAPNGIAEGAQRRFFRRWLEMMQAPLDRWPVPAPISPQGDTKEVGA